MCSVSATEEESWLTWPIASLDLYQSHTAIAVGTKETSVFFCNNLLYRQWMDASGGGKSCLCFLTSWFHRYWSSGMNLLLLVICECKRPLIRYLKTFLLARTAPRCAWRIGFVAVRHMQQGNYQFLVVLFQCSPSTVEQHFTILIWTSLVHLIKVVHPSDWGLLHKVGGGVPHAWHESCISCCVLMTSFADMGLHIFFAHWWRPELWISLDICIVQIVKHC